MTTLASSTSARRVLADVVIPRTAVANTALVLAGVVVVSALAQVSVWIGPVPITGQTLGVLLVGASLGAVRGALSLLTYVGLGLAGLPIFAAHSGGPGYLLMPSFGFLIGFVIAAYAIGWLAERQWDRHPAWSMLAFGIASAIPFITGLPYMAVVLASMGEAHDLGTVLSVGLVPFIVPGLIKWALAAALMPGAWRLVRSIEHRTRR